MKRRHNASGVKKRILFVQISLSSKGGGKAVAAWMVEALKKEYELTLLTCHAVDFEAINRHYGTSLKPSDFKVSLVPRPIQQAIDIIPIINRKSLLIWWCKIKRLQFDILMAATEFDLGSRGVQYVHYPRLGERRMQAPLRHRGLWHLLSLKRNQFYLWRIFSGFSFDRMLENKTLINSEWTKRLFYEVYGVEATTVYPPVPGNFTDIPWEKKEVGFVCIGRFDEQKRLPDIIEILAAVRSHDPNIHLHIIGSSQGCDQEHYELVRKKAEENGDWVHLNENVSREELTDLVCRHRYGIHGKVDEHFGIAVAEMVRGGCIVFVPDSGGQMEIVGNETRLLYHTDEEAVDKILGVMTRPEEQVELRNFLNARKDLFTAEQFVRRIQEVVRDDFADAG